MKKRGLTIFCRETSWGFQPFSGIVFLRMRKDFLETVVIIWLNTMHFLVSIEVLQRGLFQLKVPSEVVSLQDPQQGCFN